MPACAGDISVSVSGPCGGAGDLQVEQSAVACLYWHVVHREVPSVPTRRSSDLDVLVAVDAHRQRGDVARSGDGRGAVLADDAGGVVAQRGGRGIGSAHADTAAT